MRCADWPARLDAAVRAAAGRRFRYGSFDCCLFAADVVCAITGVDPAADLRGYHGRRAALRILAREGGLIPLVSRVLDRGPEHGSVAGRGDVVFGSPIREGAIGVCLGRQIAFAGPEGLSFHPRVIAALAWRI